MLKPLSLHCFGLCIILEYADQHLWSDVSEWLHVAASVKNVEIDTIQFDLGFGYCSGADEYAMSHETLLSTFATQLSVFSFVWGSLEAAIDVLDVPKHPDKSKRGKIADACRHISRHFADRHTISPYHEEVTAFRAALRDCQGYDQIVSQFDSASDIGVPGIGLYAVYMLRNQFAHGSLSFPFPDEENRPISSHGELLLHATRVVLLSLQMLLATYYDSLDEVIEFSWELDLDHKTFPVRFLLRTFHFMRETDGTQARLINDP